jgi:hypothetical protein
LGKFYAELGDQLSLYVRQLAWLSARPRPANAKPGEEPEILPRIRQMEEAGLVPPFPPLPPALFENPGLPIGHPVLVQWLIEIGPTEQAGMGSSAISWRTLEAWQAFTGIRLEPWQGRLLRRLSGDWLVEADKATKPDWPEPWVDPAAIAVNRVMIGRNIGSVFASMARRPGRKGLR